LFLDVNLLLVEAVAPDAVVMEGRCVRLGRRVRLRRCITRGKADVPTR